MRKISEYLKHPFLVLVALEKHNLIKLNDRYILKKLYRYNTGKTLNLEMPKTFNEKIQWLKLNDRKDIYTKMVDKYAVKEIVKNIIGEKYIIPTLGVWDHFGEIDFDSLPKKFVLKSTHDSGGIVICKDKQKLNIEEANKKISKSLKNNYFKNTREWPYKNVAPRIICEKFMENPDGIDINDYKMFLFNGKVFCIQVDYDRFIDHHRNFYDVDWNYLPFTTMYPTDPEHVIDKPFCLNEMIECAEKISKAIGNPAYVRIDMYVINDIPYFGEVTFYHGGGFEKFIPEKWNRILGDMIILPEDK